MDGDYDGEFNRDPIEDDDDVLSTEYLRPQS
jgi:hypothetical protein